MLCISDGTYQTMHYVMLNSSAQYLNYIFDESKIHLLCLLKLKHYHFIHDDNFNKFMIVDDFDIVRNVDKVFGNPIAMNSKGRKVSDQHWNFSSMSGFLVCHKCSPKVYFFDQADRYTHMELEHGMILNTCKICGPNNFKTLDRHLFVKHILKHHVKDKMLEDIFPAQCVICKTWFNSENEYENHVIKRHSEEIMEQYETEWKNKVLGELNPNQFTFESDVNLTKKIKIEIKQEFS